MGSDVTASCSLTGWTSTWKTECLLPQARPYHVTALFMQMIECHSGNKSMLESTGPCRFPPAVSLIPGDTAHPQSIDLPLLA